MMYVIFVIYLCNVNHVVHNLTLTLGSPFTPSPVTIKVAPEGGSCSLPTLQQAEVTNKISRFGPPKVAEVTCSAGIANFCRISPFLGLILSTHEPPNTATQRLPSVSMVVPSGMPCRPRCLKSNMFLGLAEIILLKFY